MMLPQAKEVSLSVIVVSFNPFPLLVRSLTALTPQIRPNECELFVVGRWPDEATRTSLQNQFPTAHILQALAQETIPLMRLRGIRAANGRIIALLEDDCLVNDNWCQTIIEAHKATKQPAVGGPIKPDNYPRHLDWAVYFCEYARFIPPLNNPAAFLSGNNVSYKKDTLPPPEALPNGLYDIFLHWQWQQNGRTLIAHPDMVVTNINRWTAENISQMPYRHGRDFAALRAQGMPLRKRLFLTAATPLLPILQLGRIIKAVGNRRRYLPKLILALPWIILFQKSWALGELVGNLSNNQSQLTGWK